MDYGLVFPLRLRRERQRWERIRRGGIAGLSTGTLRGCTARANVSASSYMGGIAGKGRNIGAAAPCRTRGYAEFQGSIAGFADGSVKDNLYSDCTIGGVDGFSFSGQAEHMDYEKFAALDGTPDSFKKISVSFSAEGKTVETIEVPFGGAMRSSRRYRTRTACAGAGTTLTAAPYISA